MLSLICSLRPQYSFRQLEILKMAASAVEGTARAFLLLLGRSISVGFPSRCYPHLLSCSALQQYWGQRLVMVSNL